MKKDRIVEVTGDNGLFKKAKESTNIHNKAKDKQEISIKLAEWKLVKEAQKETEIKTFEEFMKEEYGESKVKIYLL